MGCSRADRRHDTFAYTSDDSFLTRTTNEPLDVGANRNPRQGDQLNTVLRYRRDSRRLDDFWVDRHLHRFKDVSAGEVNGRCALKRQVDVRLICRNERIDHFLYVSAVQVMRFEL